MNRILLVEDDNDIADNLAVFLNKEGFETERAEGQTEALAKLKEDNYSLILLDISLKDGNGFAVCNKVKTEADIPVIFLTASGDEYSVVAGFDAGADDYISKPFRPRELISRINNALKKKAHKNIIEYNGITIDTEKGTVQKEGKDLFLSALEYRLFLIFLNNAGAILTRSRLLEEIWDVAGEFVNDNTLTVYIKRLREKIEENPQNPKMIVTIRGMGYKLGE